MEKAAKTAKYIVLLGAFLSMISTTSAYARMMEIDITYYDDAMHTNIVGEYYKGCDGIPHRWGEYSDYYDFFSYPCD